MALFGRSRSTEPPAVPAVVLAQGVEHRLAWSANPTAGYHKFEYVPDGQAVEAYRSMVLLETLATRKPEPMQAAITALADANRRHAAPGDLDNAVSRDAATGEVVADFLMCGASPLGGHLWEWNVYRYVAAAAGLVLFGYSLRAYGDEATPFLEWLPEGRPPMLEGHRLCPLPAVVGWT